MDQLTDKKLGHLSSDIRRDQNKLIETYNKIQKAKNKTSSQNVNNQK